jgi:hypothetical protein
MNPINNTFDKICREIGKDGYFYGSAESKNFNKQHLESLEKNGYIYFWHNNPERFSFTGNGSLLCIQFDNIRK